MTPLSICPAEGSQERSSAGAQIQGSWWAGRTLHERPQGMWDWRRVAGKGHPPPGESRYLLVPQ